MPNQRNDEQNKPLQRVMENCSIRAIEGEGNENRYRLSFSSEEPYARWWGVEILSHNEGAVDLERLNSIGVVLFNHKADNIIGRVERAWVENGRGEAEIAFDDDDYLSFVRDKVQSGTLKGVSVGYVVDSWEEVQPGKKSADGRFTGPCDIALRWCPYEISIVSVPADPTVGVGRSHETIPDQAADKPEKSEASRSLYYATRQLQINKNMITNRR